MADRTLAEVGEVELVDRLLAVLEAGPAGASTDAVHVGPGDDAAVLRLQGDVVVTTDAQHEGVHFDRAWIGPADLGARAIAVNASDLGAMGARPQAFVVALALPSGAELGWVLSLAEGLRDGARCFGAEVVGGDVAAVEAPIAINVTAIGSRATGRRAGRDGARAGQRIFLTGRPGRAAAGRRLLQSRIVDLDEHARSCVDAFRRPKPPVSFGIDAVDRLLVEAMMDVSDGVGIDLRRLCRASGVGARLDGERLLDDAPLAAVARRLDVDAEALVIAGGEDYQLLCVTTDDNADRLRLLAEEHRVRLVEVGTVVDADEGLTLRTAGRDGPLPEGGWDHFVCR